MTPEQRAAAKRAADAMRAEVDYDRLKPRATQDDSASKPMTSAQPSVQKSATQNRQGNGPVGTAVGGAADRAMQRVQEANARNEAAMKEAEKILRGK